MDYIHLAQDSDQRRSFFEYGRDTWGCVKGAGGFIDQLSSCQRLKDSSVWSLLIQYQLPKSFSVH
jgi:hypothetical protein